VAKPPKKITGEPRQLLQRTLKSKKALLFEWDRLRFDKEESAYDLREKLRVEIIQMEKDLKS
jgi:hypothetical protein